MTARPVTSAEFDVIMARVRADEAERKRIAEAEAARIRNDAHVEAGRLLAATGLTEAQRQAVAAWLRHLEDYDLIYSGCGGCGGGAGEAADLLHPPDPNE